MSTTITRRRKANEGTGGIISLDVDNSNEATKNNNGTYSKVAGKEKEGGMNDKFPLVLFCFVLVSFFSYATLHQQAHHVQHKPLVFFLVQGEDAVTKGTRRTVPTFTDRDDTKDLSAEDDAWLQNPLETFETDDCKASKEWQLGTFPSCNTLHEVDQLAISKLDSSGGGPGGAEAHVWHYGDFVTGSSVALRTMKQYKDYDPIHLERWRVESVALERLTPSPFVLNIYGHCGTAGLYEFGNFPNLMKQIKWQRKVKGGYPADVDTTELLRVAVDVAMGLSDTQTIDGDHATIGHGDITWDQFIYVGGKYKLIDFNRGYFLRWDEKNGKVCNTPNDRDIMRWNSPEEFRDYERNEKSDTYALGNVLYSIVTGLETFDGVESGDDGVGALILKGKRPFIPLHFLESKDPVYVALIKAIKKCWIGDVAERATATEVANELKEALGEIDKERVYPDGERFLVVGY